MEKERWWESVNIILGVHLWPKRVHSTTHLKAKKGDGGKREDIQAT